MNRDLFAAAGGVVDATTDPYFNSTTLLLSGDGTNGAQNNTFIDSSANNATITRAGTPTQGSFSPFSQTGWSGYFNGSSSNLQIASNAALALGTGDFTIEMWVYNTSSTNRLLSYGTVNSPILYINGSNFVQYDNYGSASLQTSSIAVPLSTWSHIAVVRLASNTKIYINGAQASTGADSTNWLQAGFYIGVDISTTFMTGYLSNLRIVKGVAVYTGAFTPPTAPLSRTQSAGTNIVALSGTETNLLTLQDNRFKDNSTNNFAITAVGTPSVQAFSPFAPTAAYSLPVAAAGSAYFNGTSNYLIAPASALWDFGSGAFTIECWVYHTASTGADQFVVYHGWAGGGALNYGWRIVILNSTNQLEFYVNGTTTTFTDLVVSPNAWTHIAFVGSGGILSVYKNGIKSVTTPTYTAIVDRPSATLGIGGFNNASENVPGRLWFGGYISNLRVVKGTAVYTGNFTPSGTPLSKIQSAGTNIASLSGTETSLLTLQDSTFKDNATPPNTITASATPPVIQSFTPFTQVWGGSFAGSSYLTIPSNTGFQFPTGTDFTVECWVNFNSVSGGTSQQILSPWGGNSGWQLYWQGANKKFTWYANASSLITGTMVPVANTWYHVAISRQNGVIKSFVNGILDYSVADTASYAQTSPLYIGVETASTGYFSGYISNVRIVKGTAVYTTTSTTVGAVVFTPPAKTLSATQAASTNISAITGTATSLLTLQDPTFKDNAILPNTITAAGTPKTQLVSAPFTSAATVDPVNGSGYFDGSSYLSVPPTSNFAFGTGDFTVECYIYGNSTTFTSGAIFSPNVYNGGSLYWAILANGGNVTWQSSHGNTNLFSISAVAYYNTWLHITVVRSSGTTKMYFNGVQVASAADSNNYVLTTTYVIARNGDGPYNMGAGYLSNFRIVKGTAVYTAIFTPPSAPLTAVTGTSLLTLQDTTFIDNSTNAAVITAGGTPVMRAFTPFTQAWGGYFPGTISDYLSLAYNPSITLSKFYTNNFTVECWAYLTTSSGDHTILSAVSTWGAGANYNIEVRAGGLMHVQLGNNINMTVGTVSFPINQWNHVALVRTDLTTTKLYLNGTAVVTNNDNWTADENCPLTIGVFNINGGSLGNSWLGYISNLRIVSGTAVYTGTFTPPTKTLSATQAAGTNISAIYPGQTSLLTLQDPTFKDNAAISNTITAVGTPKMQLISSLPFTSSATVDPVNGSAYFDGSSYVSVPDSTAFTMGSGDFTLEAWVYLTTSGVSRVIIGTCDAAGGAGSMSYVLGVNASNNATLAIGYAGALYTSTNTAIVPTNQWVHIAGVRNGGGIYAYLNGVQSTSNTSMASLAITDSTQTVAIGRNGAYNGEYLTGYISNARITKGTAVYTGNFQPPSAPLTAITGTSLLTLQDTTFIDNSTNAAVITAGGTPVMHAFTPFASNWGGYFNGSSHLVGPTGNATLNAALDILGGDFTIEFWYNPTTTNANVCILTNFTASGANGWQVGTRIGGFYLVTWTSNTSIEKLSTAIGINAGIWCHVALVKLSGNLYFYVNGTEIGMYSGYTRTATANPGAGTGLGIGAYIQNLSYPSYTSGYLSNLRVVKGTAVYTTNFQPPSAPLTAITGTSLLTLQNNTFIDNSSNAATITPSGAPKTQLLQLPFTSSITKVAAPWSIYQVTKVPAPWNISVTAPLATVGGSMYLNGTTDYLALPAGSAFAPGLGPFTVEGWYYATATSGGQFIWAQTVSGSNYFVVSFDPAGSQFTFIGLGYPVYSPATVKPNCWNHFAVVRDATNMTVYANGVAGSPIAFGTGYNFNNTTYVPVISGYTHSQTAMMTGYLSNFRYVKGTAVYTGNFTPPTAPPQPTQTPGLLGTNVNAIDGTNTSLLLLGSNAGIYDATAKNDIITVGNAQVSSTQIKYGTGAMYFDGTGDYLNIPNNQIVNFASGDYTVEAWVYPTVISSDHYVFSFGVPGGHWSINIYQSNWRVGYNLSIAGGSASAALNTWTHVAVTRSSGTQRFYLNGALISSVADTNVITANGTVYAGAYFGSGNYWNGYIDDLRATKYARYTANFTPPTKAMIGQ